jgi:hypothetical protein
LHIKFKFCSEVFYITRLLQETQQLQDLVSAYGQKWVKICKELPGRTPEQCSAKWYRSHQSKLETSGWTAEESRILEEAYLDLGGKWVAISKLLPNRTDKAVRNRFMRTIKNEEKLSADHSKKREFLASIPDVDTTANLANLEAGKVYESSATALFLKEQAKKRPRKDNSLSSSSKSIDELMASASSATPQITSGYANSSDGLITMMANSDDSEDDEDVNMDILMQNNVNGLSSVTPAKKNRKSLGDGGEGTVGVTASGRKYNRSKWSPHEV